MSRTARVSAWVFGIGAAIQFGILTGSLVVPLAEDIRRVSEFPSIQRSAKLAFGDQFAGYMEFLRREIPESATVIIPSQNVDYAFGHVGIMQYFLFPREVADCPDEGPVSECVANLTGSSTYILGVGNFPPAATALLSKDYITFEDGLGLYVPRPVDGGESP